jgi:hypothetical protein
MAPPQRCAASCVPGPETGETEVAIVRNQVVAVIAGLLLSGCFAGGYYDPGYSSYDSSASSASSSSSSSETAASADRQERSYVDRNGNIVFREPGETTIVRPDGGVTIIQRDSDGTRTTVDSDGNVSVDPPGGGCRGRKC